MRIVITVTESRSMPGTFKITSSAQRDKRGYIRQAEAKDAAGAAAKALEFAIECGGLYAIIAPASVAMHIPPDMRQRA